MRKIFFLIIASSLLFIGCINEKQPILKVGTIKGHYDDITQNVQKIAAKDGFDFEVIEFTDYIKINTALKNGDIDANIFQNDFYLAQINKERNTNFVAIAKTILPPMGLYSKKHTDVNKIKTTKNINITVPNDSVGYSRALFILAENSLIELKNTNNIFLDETFITKNPFSINIIPVDTSELRTTIDTNDFAFLPLDYALSLNINPQDALLLESTKSHFAQIIAAKKESTANENLKKLVKYYHSEENYKFILDNYAKKLIPVK